MRPRRPSAATALLKEADVDRDERSTPRRERAAADSPVLGVSGTRLTLDGRPFPLTGVSFFNALYNPALQPGAGARERWLRTFLDWGVNTLRVWCQWDFAPAARFIDTAPGHSLYADDGSLREAHVADAAGPLRGDRRAAGWCWR